MTFKIRMNREYQNHANGQYKFKRLYSGAMFMGEVREYGPKDGKRNRIFWAARLMGEQFNPERVWSFHKAVMHKLMSEGTCLTHLGILVTVDAKRKISDERLIVELWLTKMETYKAHHTNCTLSFDHFQRIEREVSDELKLKAMRVTR